MANLKNLIGKALNKAKSSKPSDDGRKGSSNVASTKTSRPAPIQAAKDKRDKEQARWNEEYKKQHEDFNYRNEKNFGKKDVLGVSYNDPKFGNPKKPMHGGTYYSPAFKEEKAKEIKRVTSPGGFEKEIKSGRKTMKQVEKESSFVGAENPKKIKAYRIN
jgi:hypothetical protein